MWQCCCCCCWMGTCCKLADGYTLAHRIYIISAHFHQTHGETTSTATSSRSFEMLLHALTQQRMISTHTRQTLTMWNSIQKLQSDDDTHCGLCCEVHGICSTACETRLVRIHMYNMRKESGYTQTVCAFVHMLIEIHSI